MRKALCSVGAGPHAALLAVSEPTFRAYAERHGYELLTSTAAPSARPPAWAKVPLLREALDRFDLVLWIDADAVIVDAGRDIADELDGDRALALVQHRHGDAAIPNTGVMLLRSGELCRSLLDDMWAAKRYVHHPWWENAALLDALGYDVPRFSRMERLLRRRSQPCRPARPSRYRDATQFLPGEWNWSYLDRAPNPRIVHCLGVPVEQRLRDMRAAIEGRLR